MRFSRRSLSLLLLLALVGLAGGTLLAAAPHRSRRFTHVTHSPGVLLARLTSPSRLTPPPHRLPGATGLTTFGGTITSASGAASSVVCPSADQATVACQVTGTWVATLIFQATVDGVNWVAVHANATTSDTVVAGPSTNGLFLLVCSGFTGVRLHATVYTSGTAVVTFGAGPGSSASLAVSMAGGGGGGGGGAVTLADGADVNGGTTTDAAVQGDNPGTVSAKLRGLNKSVAAGVPVTGTFFQATQPVSGTFFQATQPVSGTVTANVGTTNGLFLDSTFTGRLPSAAALADAMANPVLTQLQIFPSAYNGTTWDRARSVTSATGTTGTGLPGVGPLLWDSVGATNFVKQAGDGSGRAMVVGAAAAGAAIAGNPVQVGGSDGTNARALKTDASGNLQVGAVAGTAAIGNVGGLTKTISVTLTRAATTTTYTANDEMTDTGGAIRTISNAATATGGSGIITHCFMSCSSNGATKPTFTVYVYDTTSTPAADNAPFVPTSGVQDTAVGYFTLSSSEVGDATALTGNYTMDSGQIHLPYTTSGSANLFFRVKVTNGYTPGANSDTYKWRFQIQQDSN